MVKMILLLPARVNADDFVELATTVVLGRYGKHGYYNGLAAPKVEWIGAGGSKFRQRKTYAIDAEEIDPAFISAVEYLGKFLRVNFYFVNGNKVLAKDWWRPSSKYFERGGIYLGDDAGDAYDEYTEKLAELNGKKYAKKIAL